jgi:Phosphotransferase enzyme family
VWHADCDAAAGTFVMVLEDLDASGCRFLRPSDDDVLDVATSLMDELATLHAAYRHRELSWLRTPPGMRRKPDDPETAARRAQFIASALDQFAANMPPVFRRLGELYGARSLDIIALFNEGERTLIHRDTHSGNLFVDAGRTGFYDWAVAGRGPGVRDVAYFLRNSVPVEARRAEEKALLAQYRSGLARHGVTLEERTYRVRSPPAGTRRSWRSTPRSSRSRPYRSATAWRTCRRSGGSAPHPTRAADRCL